METSSVHLRVDNDRDERDEKAAKEEVGAGDDISVSNTHRLDCCLGDVVAVHCRHDEICFARPDDWASGSPAGVAARCTEQSSF